MTHKHAIQAFDRTMRDICDNDQRPFGGDWQQILPVIRHGGRVDVVQATLKKSYLWKHVQVLTLSVNMRLQAAGTAFSAAERQQ